MAYAKQSKEIDLLVSPSKLTTADKQMIQAIIAAYHKNKTGEKEPQSSLKKVKS